MIVTERKLVVFCIACSIAGIAALFVASMAMEPAEVSVQDAALDSFAGGSNSKVKVVGFVDSVAIGKSFATIKLGAVQTMEATSFDVGYIGGLGLKRFQEVELYGEMRQYKGKNTLIISHVKTLGKGFNLT